MEIRNTNNTTKEMIIEEAEKMWKKRQSLSDEEFESIVTSTHHNFIEAYPMAVAMMKSNLFTLNSFSRFLDWLEKNPWTNEDEYIDAQAEYCVRTIETHQKIDKKKEKAKIVRRLKDEADEIKKKTEEAKKEVELTQSKLMDESRAELKRFYTTTPKDSLGDPVIRVRGYE